MKFQEKLYKYMYGRYGIDQLYYFLFFLYVILIVLNLFFKSDILFIIELVLLVVMMYRVMSKKIYVRTKENNLYLKYKNKFLKPFHNIKRNFKDRKKYVYKKCSNCKTTLRLPIPEKRGIKKVICPDCKKKLTVFTLRQKRIEIIRNKKG